MRVEWTGDWTDCFYAKRDWEQEYNVQAWADWANAQTHMDFYWPNYDASPWHIQCIIEIDGSEVEVNFWPHKNKAQFKYEKAIEPMSAFVAELKSRINGDDDDFDVIE